MRENLKADHGGKAYKDIDWALKINESAIARKIPLLIEFDNYDDRGTDTMRLVRMFYNRPVSLGVDYVVNNPKHRETSK